MALLFKQFARKLFGRDKAPLEKAKPLLDGVKRVLENTDGIENIRWWYE